jgi:uncharacterized protein (DUF697 family)
MDITSLTSQLSKSLEMLEGVLGKLPAPVASSVRDDIAELRQLLLDQRPPRVALIGATDVTGHAAIDALMGERAVPIGSWRDSSGFGEWTRFVAGEHELSVLDTRTMPIAELNKASLHSAPDLVLDVVRHADREAVVAEVATQINKVPNDARVQLARMAQIKDVQRAVADDLTAATASIAGGIAAVPIPLADIAPITAAQVSLVAAIGYISGREMSAKTAAEFVAALGASVGAAIALRHVARAVTKAVIPGAGSVVSAGVAWAGTRAVGAAAIAYFIDRQSKSQAREQFQIVVKQPQQLPKSLKNTVSTAE